MIKKIIIALIPVFIALTTFNCEKPKPEFIPYEDYSYLKDNKNNKTLLIVSVNFDTEESIKAPKPDEEIQNILYSHNFQYHFRKALVKEFLKRDTEKKLNIEFNEKSEDINIKYSDYIGLNYPDEISENYDLILEIDVNSILYYGVSHYVHAKKRQTIRLLDAKTGQNYLSSFTEETINSIGEKIILKRYPDKFITVLQNLVNRSTPMLTKYILNQEPLPDKDKITPLPPELRE